MSVIVEHHTCLLVVAIPERMLSPGTWRCTHINVDGVPCRNTVTGYGHPGSPAASHVTSSEAVTAWFHNQVRQDGNVKSSG